MAQMTRQEWESLCDGCGRCCLLKFEDEDTDELVYTSVVCRLFDEKTCRCTDYVNRGFIETCLIMDASLTEEDYAWMPKTCAYRRLHEGRDLAWWHPLVSGRKETVFEAGIAVRGRVISESLVHPEQVFDFEIELDNGPENDGSER